MSAKDEKAPEKPEGTVCPQHPVPADLTHFIEYSRSKSPEGTVCPQCPVTHCLTHFIEYSLTY